MGDIDAHCHFWRLDRGEYAWLDGSGGPLQPIRRDFLPDDYPSDQSCIVVQAAASHAETDFLLELAGRDARILGVVGWADLTDRGSSEVLRQWASGGVLRGIRPMLQDIEEVDWLVDQALPEIFQILESLDLTFDALVTERHLPMLERFIDRHPGLPVVIDHGAKPQPNRGDAWARGMKALADKPHVHCKLSGLTTELSAEDLANPLPPLREIVDALLEWFGPQRLIWGSDWPVLTLAGSFERWKELTEALLSDLSPAERSDILGGNARRFYGVGA